MNTLQTELESKFGRKAMKKTPKVFKEEEVKLASNALRKMERPYTYPNKMISESAGTK